MSVYNHAFEQEMLRVEEIAGELNARWKVHLWITKAGLTHHQKTQLLTATSGTFKYANFSR